MEIEVWKTHPIFGGKYEVSSIGNIRHIKNKNNLAKRLNFGYVYPTLSNDRGRPCSKRLHRLIADVFIQNPNNKPFVNHINGVKTDNRVENLEWCTASENNIHSINELGNKTNNGQKKPIIQYDKEMNKIAEFDGVSIAGRMLGISHQQISNNLKMKQKYCHGFIFKYQEA